MRTAIQAIAVAAIVLKVAAAPIHILITLPKHEPRSIIHPLDSNTHEWKEDHPNEIPTLVHVPNRHYKRDAPSTEAARCATYRCLAAIHGYGGKIDYVPCLNDIRGCGSPSAIDLEFHRTFNDHNVTWPQQIKAMFSEDAPVNPNTNETVEWDSGKQRKRLDQIFRVLDAKLSWPAIHDLFHDGDGMPKYAEDDEVNGAIESLPVEGD